MEKEHSTSYDKPHPNTFKRNTLNNYNNFNTPISFNNFNNSKVDEKSFINNTNINEDSYDDYESVSETEYSESIYRMIKLDKKEEEESKKKKSSNRLSKTPGAFPYFSTLDKNKLEEIDDNESDDDQDYLSYFDMNYKYNDYYNEDDSLFKNTNSDYLGITKNTNNIDNNKNDKFNTNYYSNKSNISEKSRIIIQTEPPPSIYYSLTKKLNIFNIKSTTSKYIQNIYNNLINKIKISYEQINNLLEFVRKPFNLFTVSSEKYNNYQLYKPIFDVINLIFQFTLNGTWIWKKVYSLLDFFSYFKTGQIINRYIYYNII